MKLIFLSTLAILFPAFFVKAQTNRLQINSNINLPKDSVETGVLIASLNDFLASALQPNKENKLVLATEKLETFILLDEINGMEKSGKFKDDHFYKPYLTNVVSLKDGNYFIQLSYIGINENTPFLRASVELVAHKTNGLFLFSSPLLGNTKTWKTEKVGNSIFHYQTRINKTKTKEYDKLASSFDKKLKAINKVTEFYCCENIIELQKLIGVQYKSDYNGRTENILSSSLGDRSLIILGNNNSDFNDFDQHDLWHDRLELVIPRSQVNRPIDEGCAYLYGGSWGMSWKDIFKEFKEQIAINKNTNWAEIKENPITFKTKGFNNSADYIVNALLVQKIEKEKGFAAVWEFLNCGKFE